MTKKEAKDIERKELEVAPQETEELEEMENLASKVPDGAHKKNLKSVAMHTTLKKLAGMKSDEVEHFEKSIASIGHEADSIDGGAASKNKASLAMHPSAASAMQEAIKEDLDAVFGGDEKLSDEFKTNMTTLFEAAIGSRAILIEAEIEEMYEQKLAEDIEEISAGLVEKMDEYLDYVCEEWIKENEVAIESTIRSEITEGFIDGLKTLFQENFIEVPEDRLDVLEGLAQKVDELESALNESEKGKLALSEKLKSHEKKELVEKKAEGLTPIQTEKFGKLAEGLDYDGDQETFDKSLDVIKEHHFSKKGKSAKTNLITEEIAHDPNDPVDTAPRPVRPEMKPYVEALKKTIRAHH